MELVIVVGNVSLFVGSLGLFEMLATANEKWTKERRLTREVRFEMYFAACLAAALMVIRTALYGPIW